MSTNTAMIPWLNGYSWQFWKTINNNIGSFMPWKQSQADINVGFRLDIPNFTADELCKFGQGI